MRFILKIALLLSLAAAISPAAELNGIWTGLVPGRKGVMEDIAFEFKTKGQVLTGTLFGDEFDLPIQEASITGEQVRFSVTATNYYSGSQIQFIYTGKISGDSLELTRERVLKPGEKPPAQPNPNPTFILKRLIP